MPTDEIQIRLTASERSKIYAQVAALDAVLADRLSMEIDGDAVSREIRAMAGEIKGIRHDMRRFVTGVIVLAVLCIMVAGASIGLTISGNVGGTQLEVTPTRGVPPVLAPPGPLPVPYDDDATAISIEDTAP